MLVNEGLVYTINSSLGVSVGGAPAPKTQWYLFLTTANRAWSASDAASNIHTVSGEFENYTEGLRPTWSPGGLAENANISLDSAGTEALFTVGDVSGEPGGTVLIYGAGIISVSPKDGSSDGSATLVAGGNFTSPRELSSGDKFYVGAVINASDNT